MFKYLYISRMEKTDNLSTTQNLLFEIGKDINKKIYYKNKIKKIYRVVIVL